MLQQNNIDEVKKLASLGYSKKAISIILNVEEKTVYIFCKKNKIEVCRQKEQKVESNIDHRLDSHIIDCKHKDIPPHTIGLELGISTDLIFSFLREKGFVNVRFVSEETKNKTKQFIEECQKAIEKGQKINKNALCRDLDLHVDAAENIIKKAKLRDAIKDKTEANREIHRLTLEEAQKRVTSGTVIGRDEDGEFLIKASDGFIFKKAVEHLTQHDPRLFPHFLTEDILKERLAQVGLEYVGGYVNSKTVFNAICKKGHPRRATIDGMLECPCLTCKGYGFSNAEIELKKEIESWGIKAVKHTFKEEGKRGKEIDIYLPDFKIGIEYCGLYWHSEEYKKDKKYHFNKMKQANNEGIDLITVFEDEYVGRKGQLINLLKSKCGVFSKKVYARKCQVVELNFQQTKDFLDKTHIQGHTNFKISYGLIFEGILVGCMIGGLHHTSNNNEELILKRMAFLSGYQVVGGASKLLSKLKEYAKINNYKVIKTWSDNRISMGNVYKQIGFELLNEIPSDYSYIVPGKVVRVPKQSCRKIELFKKGASIGTESEMAEELGYKKIWDCGKKTWILKIGD